MLPATLAGKHLCGVSRRGGCHLHWSCLTRLGCGWRGAHCVGCLHHGGCGERPHPGDAPDRPETLLPGYGLCSRGCGAVEATLPAGPECALLDSTHLVGLAKSRWGGASRTAPTAATRGCRPGPQQATGRSPRGPLWRWPSGAEVASILLAASWRASEVRSALFCGRQYWGHRASR